MPTDGLSDWELYEVLLGNDRLTGEDGIDLILMEIYRFSYHHSGSSLSSLGEWLVDQSEEAIPQSA